MTQRSRVRAVLAVRQRSMIDGFAPVVLCRAQPVVLKAILPSSHAVVVMTACCVFP